jgi:5'-3' exonuclease
MRLHLLDGTYELFRSYFGAPRRTAPDGREVGAIAGILASTLALLEGDGVTHLGAAFDTVIRSFRNDLLASYKTEEGVVPELLDQFPLAERALEALGVVVWPMVDYEADDAIATAAARWAADVDQVVILTPDKDLAQCVEDPRVVTYDRRKSRFFDEAGVRERFGVDPESIPDYLALVGDTADGLPGLPGWGAKSTAVVLSRYGHLEDIPPDEADWDVGVRGSARLAEALRDGMEHALLYRDLATLRTDVPLAESLDDLEWRGARRDAYLALCDELGLDRLRDRPSRWR